MQQIMIIIIGHAPELVGACGCEVGGAQQRSAHCVGQSGQRAVDVVQLAPQVRAAQRRPVAHGVGVAGRGGRRPSRRHVSGRRDGLHRKCRVQPRVSRRRRRGDHHGRRDAQAGAAGGSGGVPRGVKQHRVRVVEAKRRLRARGIAPQIDQRISLQRACALRRRRRVQHRAQSKQRLRLRLRWRVGIDGGVGRSVAAARGQERCAQQRSACQRCTAARHGGGARGGVRKARSGVASLQRTVASPSASQPKHCISFILRRRRAVRTAPPRRRR